MIGDHRLDELGDRLEQAIDDRLTSGGASVASGDGQRRPLAIVTTASVAVVLIATVAVLSRSGEEPERSVLSAAPVEVQVAPSSYVVGEGLAFSAERFGSEVFVHLPMSDGSDPSCSERGDLRFTCTGQLLVAAGAHQIRFVIDQRTVLGGACRQRGADRFTWDCSLSEAAIQDGMLDRHEFDELTD